MNATYRAINRRIGDRKLLKLQGLRVALSATLAFAHGVGAAEEPWYDKAEAISNGIPREAQKALVCEVVSNCQGPKRMRHKMI